MENVIAVINGKEITSKDFAEFLKSVPQEQRAYFSHPEAQEYFKEQMLAVYLFEAYGQELEIEKSEEYAKRMEDVKRGMISQLAMEKLLSDVSVSEDEMKVYFENNKSKYAKGPSANAKHILMDDEAKILEVLEKINSGEQSFEDAAKENSSCPSGQKGGDLGTFGRGQMVKEFDEVCFTGEIGKVLGPVKTQFGYHLIRIESRTDGAESTFEEAMPRIKNELLSQKQQKVYTDKLVELKEKYQTK